MYGGIPYLPFKKQSRVIGIDCSVLIDVVIGGVKENVVHTFACTFKHLHRIFALSLAPQVGFSVIRRKPFFHAVFVGVPPFSGFFLSVVRWVIGHKVCLCVSWFGWGMGAISVFPLIFPGHSGQSVLVYKVACFRLVFPVGRDNSRGKSNTVNGCGRKLRPRRFGTLRHKSNRTRARIKTGHLTPFWALDQWPGLGECQHANFDIDDDAGALVWLKDAKLHIDAPS